MAQLTRLPSLLAGRPVDRYRIVLDDGREFYVYNRGRDGHNWIEVSAANAQRRVFVDRGGRELYWFDFETDEDRSTEPNCLLQQLAKAMARGH